MDLNVHCRPNLLAETCLLHVFDWLNLKGPHFSQPLAIVHNAPVTFAIHCRNDSNQSCAKYV